MQVCVHVHVVVTAHFLLDVWILHPDGICLLMIGYPESMRRETEIERGEREVRKRRKSGEEKRLKEGREREEKWERRQKEKGNIV